jgi:hypothetical protein
MFFKVLRNCQASTWWDTRHKKSSRTTYTAPAAIHRNGVPPTAKITRARTMPVSSTAAAIKAARSHQGVRSFIPAQARSQDMGWWLSFETTNAISHSASDAGFACTSLRRASRANTIRRSYAMSLGTDRSGGDSGSVPFIAGTADSLGRLLRSSRCSSLRGSLDRAASRSICPITNARAWFKSTVSFTETSRQFQHRFNQALLRVSVSSVVN